jgi:hypothetical protein
MKPSLIAAKAKAAGLLSARGGRRRRSGATDEPPFWAPAKVSGKYLSQYLAAKNVVHLPLRARRPARASMSPCHRRACRGSCTPASSGSPPWVR